MKRRLVIGDIHSADTALKQCLWRASYSPENDLLIFLGDYIDGWSKCIETVDLLMDLDQNGYCIFLKGNHDCLSEDTELCTQRGWLSYKNIEPTDKILSIDPADNCSKWTNINSVIIKQSNHLNLFNSTRIDLSCTDNHRILNIKEDKIVYNKIGDVKSNSKKSRLKIPLAVKNNNDSLTLNDDELKLIAWIISDGHISDKYQYITIYQSKKSNMVGILEICERLKLEYTYIERVKKVTEIKGVKLKKSEHLERVIKIKAKSSRYLIDKYHLINNRIPKNILYNMSFDNFKVFFETLILADGTKYLNSENYILYGTLEFLEDVQILCCQNGYSANLTKDKRGDLRLNISENNFSYIRNDKNKSTQRITGDFIVWCLNTTHSNFLIRRNGKAHFTGNCWLEDYLMSGIADKSWLNNGGDITYDKYLLNFDKQHQHLPFFRKLHNYYVSDDNIAFVHAGYDSIDGLGNDHLDTYLWDRDLWYKGLSSKNTTPYKPLNAHKEIFIGHTATVHWDTDKPMNVHNLWNLDTGAGWYGKLTIMDVDTKEYWQSDSVQELFKNEQGRN